MHSRTEEAHLGIMSRNPLTLLLISLEDARGVPDCTRPRSDAPTPRSICPTMLPASAVQALAWRKYSVLKYRLRIIRANVLSHKVRTTASLRHGWIPAGALGLAGAGAQVQASCAHCEPKHKDISMHPGPAWRALCVCFRQRLSSASLLQRLPPSTLFHNRRFSRAASSRLGAAGGGPQVPKLPRRCQVPVLPQQAPQLEKVRLRHRRRPEL